MSKVVKLGADDLRKVIKEEAQRVHEEYPQIGGTSDEELVPFAPVQKKWLELSGGLEPDEVEPEEHEEFIVTIAAGLGVPEDAVRDLIQDWGEATSLGALTDAVR
jgi:hypothetical protein